MFAHVFTLNDNLALRALETFVNKYLDDMFSSGDSSKIFEKLSLMRRLLAFHDPELASHLDTLEFREDLYAVPWLLTAFSRKIFFQSQM